MYGDREVTLIGWMCGEGDAVDFSAEGKEILNPQYFCGKHVNHSIYARIEFSTPNYSSNIKGAASIEDNTIATFLEKSVFDLCNKDWSVI